MASNATAGEVKRQLMKKYHIHFDGPIESIDIADRPRNHEITFKHIRQLGKTELERYQETIDVDLHHRPWKERVPRRAKRIAELAKLCRQGRKNEAGWRLTLEPEVLARLSVEVAW
jgi:hypothetical protein